jgi:gliding motility-associated-like protein
MNFQQSDTFGGLSSGTYSVIIRDSEGCEWDSIVILGDGINISIDLGPDLTLEPNEIFVLEPSIQSTGSIDSISWSPAQFLSCINCLTPSVSSPQPDSFEIYSIVFSASCFDTDTLLVIIHDTYSVFVPNVFSPNGDSINDYFTIYTNDRLGEILELNIYDRWGEHLFRGTGIPPNNPGIGWNGHFKGKQMNPGVYVYTVQIKFNDGSIQLLSGDVTLLR